MTSLNPIVVFVDDLMREAGFSHLPLEFQKSYKEKLTYQVYRRLGILALKELSDKDLDDFNKLMSQKVTPEAVIEFFRQRVKNFEEKMAYGLNEFRKEFLASVKK